ncbi:MAG: substrate-binding periplasmic protein, partial [Bacteroidia bacterium]
KSPKTGIGRLVGLIWMFASLIMVSYFTASIASALTVQRIGDQFDDPSDLEKVSVGAIKGTITESYLKNHRIDYVTANNFDELTEKLNAGEIDALVADYPILKYFMNTNKVDNLKMLPHKIHEFFYAIPISNNMRYREQINESLQQYIETDEWGDQLFNYLGETD